MTVQELIEELMKIEDKSIEVKHWDEYFYTATQVVKVEWDDDGKPVVTLNH